MHFQGVSIMSLWVIQWCFNWGFKVIEDCFKGVVFLKVCCCMVVIAATRAERGLGLQGIEVICVIGFVIKLNRS